MKPKTILPFFRRTLVGYSLVTALCGLLYTALSGWAIPTKTMHTLLNIQGNSWDQECIKGIKFSPEMIERLKKTTLVFVLREEDKPTAKDFERMLQASWTFTKSKVITYDQLAAHSGSEYTQCVLHSFFQDWVNGGGKVISYLSIKHTYLDTDQEPETVFLARWDLDIEDVYRGKVNDHSSKAQGVFYEQPGLVRNWTPGILSLYLKETERNLHMSQRESLLQPIRNEAEMEALKSDTLYIPERVMRRYNHFNGKQKAPHKVEELFKDYPSTCYVLNDAELSERILNKEAKYVLDYITIDEGFLLRVLNIEKAMVFQTHKRGSWELAPKDIKVIYPKK